MPKSKRPLLLTLCCVLAAANSFAAEDLMFEEIPQVISSSQMYQPQNRSPASVATIDSDTIEKQGFNSIEEICAIITDIKLRNYTVEHIISHTEFTQYGAALIGALLGNQEINLKKILPLRDKKMMKYKLFKNNIRIPRFVSLRSLKDTTIVEPIQNNVSLP